MLKLSLPFNSQAFTLPLSIFILAIVVYLLPDSISEYLIFDRSKILVGEYWRLITGHFAHTNFNHLLLNLTGLTMLWALHGEHYSNKTYNLSFFVSALICSVGIFYFNPEMHRYVGLSGVLHGIFVWGAICDIQKGWKSGYLLLIGVWGKVLYEQIFGASREVETLINASVAIDAHLWGAIGGLMLPMTVYLKHQIKNKI